MIKNEGIDLLSATKKNEEIFNFSSSILMRSKEGSFKKEFIDQKQIIRSLYGKLLLLMVKFYLDNGKSNT